MLLFIAGHGPGGPDVSAARDALRELVSELPFFDPSAIETWTAPAGHVAIACVAHAPALVGGVHYRAFERDRAALFAGRPVLWRADGTLDGRDVLDPRAFLRARTDDWAEQLDGRCTVLRADATTLELYSDPLGAYPLFEARAGAVRWFSNNGTALRLLTGDRALDEEVLASVLAGGWSLGGKPLWRPVARVDRGVLLRIGAAGERRRELLPLERIAQLPGAGLDVHAAATQLVELVRALADWPGRPSVVGLTGGRDSRVILAAALRAGIPFDALTGGAHGDPDVEVAARLCATTARPHGLLSADPHGDRFSDLARAARLTSVSASGIATLENAAGFPLGPRDGPLPLWHFGQGGEIARGYYGLGDSQVADRLYARFSGRRPGRSEIVSAEAASLLRARIGEFVERMQAAGAAQLEIPDLFYLLERMACWAAPSHSAVELIRDTTSPLWSRAMLPHLLGLPARDRALDAFHLQLLRELAPELIDEPFADRTGWQSRESPVRRRLRRAGRLSRKALGELRRRAEYHRAARPGPTAATVAVDRVEPFDAILEQVREATLDQPGHSAWRVLDRARVERLLSSPAAALDEMSRYYVWRLGSVFLGA
ncbi:MAG TPA: hypothetical protein VL977_06280 [Solirubrobacteraceae bacterium]|nr:hypothetical protein [Solirubrobacteraceae bacterium]